MTKKWTGKRAGAVRAVRVPARVRVLALGLLLTAAGSPGAAWSEEGGREGYGAGGGGAAAGEDAEFHRAVDLKRFRNKNFEWDTQELIASGFTALHKENQRILRELAEIKERIGRLEEKKVPQKSY